MGNRFVEGVGAIAAGVALAGGLAGGLAASGCGGEETRMTSTSGGAAGEAGGQPTSGGFGGEPADGGMGGTVGNDFAEPCTENAECEPGFCIPEATTGWPMGYCTELCNDLAPCAMPGTQCVDIGTGSFCLRDCSPSGQTGACAPHQACFDLGNGAGVCGPGCRTDLDCPVLGQCDDDGFCVEPEDCGDALDNDQDGLTDCEDEDCSASCQGTIDATCAAATVAGASQSGDTSGGSAAFSGSCTGSGGALEDVYAYTVATDGLLSLRLSSDSDQGVYVRSACGDASTELACADTALGGAVESTYLPVTSGSALSIFVDGYLSPLEAGPYTLDVSVLPLTLETEDNGTFGSADAFVAATAFSGAITMNDHDWIAVDVPGPASTMRVEVVAGGSNDCNGDIDSEVQILDIDGQSELAFNDDISPFGNFCSTATATGLAAGTYFVRVSASQAFCVDCAFDYNLLVEMP